MKSTEISLQESVEGRAAVLAVLFERPGVYTIVVVQWMLGFAFFSTDPLSTALAYWLCVRKMQHNDSSVIGKRLFITT